MRQYYTDYCVSRSIYGNSDRAIKYLGAFNTHILEDKGMPPALDWIRGKSSITLTFTI